MASGAKRKTTMAKLNRESKLRERRLYKQAKKEARRREQAVELDPSGSDGAPNAAAATESTQPDDAPTAV
jgi:hypothetical protein